TFNLTPLAAGEKTQTFFTDKFDLKPRRNVSITAECPRLNGYLVAEGDLVEDSTGLIQPFLLPMARESGVEDGESWTEGDTVTTTTVSAQPGGTYSLKLEVEREHGELAGPLTVRVEQGVSRGINRLLTLAGLLAIPVGVGIYHLFF